MKENRANELLSDRMLTSVENDDERAGDGTGNQPAFINTETKTNRREGRMKQHEQIVNEPEPGGRWNGKATDREMNRSDGKKDGTGRGEPERLSDEWGKSPSFLTWIPFAGTGSRNLGLLILSLFLSFLSSGLSETRAQVPGTACDSIGITPRYTEQGCCWNFVLNNNQNFTLFNSVSATVVNGAGSFSSVSGGFPGTSSGINANWSFPNNLPKGNTTIGACFNVTSSPVQLIFSWSYQGIVICRDTVTIDCPGTGGGTDTCATDSLLISTGWNPYTNSLHSVGQYTSFWQVVGDPSPNTTEPRPASVISPITAWAGPLGTSRWISSYPTASNDTNGTYVFQTCFCVKDPKQKVRLIMDILADDRARVYVNGNLVGSTPLSYAFQAPATHIDSDITQYLMPGRNCIKVEVDNTNSVAMGLDINGVLRASGIGLERSVCCNQDGTLTGMKFWDKDCDGKRGAGEPGRAGWTIVLSNGDTAVTDALGNYYFNNLPPGPYTIAEVNQPGWSQSYPSSPGTHNAFLAAGEVKGNLNFGNCRKDPQPDGCFEYRPDTTFCEGVNGQANFYIHKFHLRSNLPCNYSQSASINVLSPSGVGVSPSSFGVNSTMNGYSITIGGPGAVAGAVVVLQVKVCCIAGGGNGTPGDTLDCCVDTIRIVLPECGPQQGECKDCCKDFPKKFFRLTQWSASSGLSNISGLLQAGNTQICKVSATLVEARVNGQPVYGQFIPLNILGSTPGTIPYMHEVIWTGTDVSGGPTPFSLRLQFPAIAWNSLSDNIEYCVRFRFSDRNCVTCDTVICFRQKRVKWIFPGGGILLPSGIEKKENRPQVQGGNSPAVFEGTLTGEESGHLNVNFPTPPAELGSVTYVGLRVDPAEEFVEITGATSPDYAYSSSSFGVESEPFSAQGGSSTSLDLSYNGLNNRSQLDHYITIRFVLDAAPEDTLEESGIITFYRNSLVGGDELTQEKLGMEVKTFALYLHNANGSDEPIDRLALNVEEGVEIIAVGPSPNERTAVIALSEGARDGAGIDLGLGSTLLDADGTVGPIYITLAGVSGSTDLTFTTLSDRGLTISEGSIRLVDVPSSVEEIGSGSGSSVSLLSEVFPNPTDDGATIRFRLTEESRAVTMVVVDAAGHEVERLLDGASLHAGEHLLWFDAGDLSSGSYFVTLRAGSSIVTRPLQIRR